MKAARDYLFVMDGATSGRPWSQSDIAELKARWKAGEGMSAIAKAMGRTRNAITGKSNVLNLQFAHGHSFEISENHPAVIIGTTRYSSRVQAPPRIGVLKPGSYQRKLGKTVTKGHWKDWPIYSLTLEERATCPRDCAQFSSCYGNSMGQAIRYRHGPELEASIRRDLDYLSRQHRQGYVVRLHILGDFVSVPYVEFWRDQLAHHPDLHIFGYTARQEGTPIGDAIAHLRREQWARFAVRTSGASSGPRTNVIDTPDQAEPSSIICPAQTGKTRCCSSCALCWTPAARDREILFLRH